MPTWNDILDEVNANPQAQVDAIRQKYLKELSVHTDRNVIAYYSGWLIPRADDFNVSINDLDKHAFMTVMKGLDKSKGLDLILHTPGGSIDATESLVEYLWSLFNKDVRVIVPQLAMSAGTMIACSAKSVVMGKHSNLGPFDPQMYSPGIGFNIPAQGVIDEYEVAKKEIGQDSASIPLWQTIYSRIHPSFMNECLLAMTMSADLVKGWLIDNMLDGNANKETIAQSIVDELTDHESTKSHGRHISRDKCEKLGLVIEKLEDNDVFQDLVLSVHHSFMITFSQTPARKIVECSNSLANVAFNAAK